MLKLNGKFQKLHFDIIIGQCKLIVDLKCAIDLRLFKLYVKSMEAQQHSGEVGSIQHQYRDRLEGKLKYFVLRLHIVIVKLKRWCSQRLKTTLKSPPQKLQL